MTTILPASVFKKTLSLIEKYFYYFLFLIFMLYSNSVFSQLVSNFTTTSSNTGCGSLVVEFEDLSAGNPNTWLWDFGNGNISTLQNPVSVYSNPGFYTVKLTVTNSTSNDMSMMVDYIKIYVKPISEFTENTTAFCVPEEVNFTDESISLNNIVSWNWDFGDGGSSTQQNPVYEYLNNGIFTVSLSVLDDKGCESIIVLNNLIDAKDVPQANFSSNISVSCDATEIITFNNSSLFSDNYTWSFGDGQISSLHSPLHNYISGIYNVTLVSDNGICADTLVQNNLIEVGAVITPDFVSDNNSVCKQSDIQFTDMSTYSPDSWLWNFGDGQTSTLQNPTHSFLNSGNYSVSLTISKNGECIETIEKIDFIKIFEDPDVLISANEKYSCILPFNVSFQDNTLNSVTWDWNFGNGDSSNLKDPIVSFNTYDDFDVELNVTDINGCVSTLTETDFIITDLLKPEFTVSDSIICESDIISFTDITSSVFPIVSYLWDFGDGQNSILQNPTHQFVGVNIFDITYTIENSMGCVEELTMPNFVKTVGSANADFSSDILISCAGEDINFTDLSSSLALISNWKWSFGDGNTSVLQNPTHQYNQTGLFSVTLLAGEGNCTDTIRKNNYIEIVDPASFFITKYSCTEPFMVEFNNLSIGADEVEWDFGDGTISTDFNATHVFTNTGQFNVTLRVTNNATLCTHEYVEQIKITVPQANFTYLVNLNNSLEDSVVCATKKRSYIENLTPDCQLYRVDWGDGYMGIQREDHLYTETGVYDVTLMITDIHGCKDTMVIEDMFRVSDVVSEFTVSNVIGCDSLIVDFEDLSSVTSDVIWDFGDGFSSSINNPQHVFLNEGYYDVTLFSKSVDGCLDTLRKKEYIKFIYPEIDFSISDTEICKNEEVVFSDSSKGIALDYNWDFGDGSISSSRNPSYNYSTVGVFPISLSITDTFGCTTVKNTDMISVQEVIADFTSNIITSNCPPLITTFTNQSSGNIVDYNWDFGDGLNSFQSSPSHLYSFSGSFDVQLIIEDDFECKDTLKFANLISIFGPTGDFTFNKNIMCNYDSVEFAANVLNTDTYLWDFGDGTYSIDSNPTHIYSSGNYFHPLLIIENSSSCQLIVPSQDSIEVVEIIIDAGLDVSMCLGDSIALSASGSVVNYIWNSSPFISSISSYNTVVFPNVSTMFYVSNSDGMCSASDSVFVIVDSNIPQPTFSTINNCFQDSMLLSAISGIVASSFDWEWSILGENLYTQEVYFQFDTIGVFEVEVLVTNLDNNCDATIKQFVEVFPLPLVDFTSDEVCSGDKTNFTNLSGSDVVSALWSFGDGYQSSFNLNPNIVFSTSGLFQSTLVVSSDVGCLNSITKEVIVHEIPELEISVSEVCEGFENTFTSSILLNDGFITNWNWDFGDETILSDLENTVHIYEDWGEFDINLQVKSNFGCTNSINGTSIVHPNPEVSFLVKHICEGDITKFTSDITLEQGVILNYDWNFGDGNTSVFANPSNQFNIPSSYPITLSVSSVKGCSISSQKSIQIHSLPEVDFLVDREVCESEEINFVDNTISDGFIRSYDWDFGDRKSSTQSNPIHTYKNSGIYKVSLSVESDYGCKNNIVKDSFITVSENPTALFDMSDNRVGLLNSEITFINNSDDNLFFEWDFDNGILNSDDSQINISFDQEGDYNVLLYVENDFGCSDEIIHQVVVEKELSVFVPTAFTPNNDGLNDIFEAITNGAVTFEMSIFNRWGELIFSSYNPELGWNGTSSFSGEIMEHGTYLYTILVTDNNDKPWVYNGELNLMK